VNILNKNSVIDLIYSIKNSSLLLLLLIFPYHLYDKSMKIYIFPIIIISFGIFYYISYVMSRNIIEILKKNSVLLGGIIFSLILPLIFYVDNYFILFVLAAVLAFSASLIDYWSNMYRKRHNMAYVYTGIVLGGIFAGIHFVDLKIIYIVIILSSLLVIFSVIFNLFTYQNVNYKKTLLTKKIKRYIISIGDIRRIRNGWALFSAIIINSLLYMSVATILIAFPLLVIEIHAISIIYEFICISSISFFTIFLGSLLKSRLFQGISFIAIFPLLILIGFIISIKNVSANLSLSLLFIPLVTFMVPGYRKYISRKFPGSEIYYVNKFANFFTGIFIMSVPFIMLFLIGFPVYAVIIELAASMIALILCLKFINYPEIVFPRKHKN
jgi:hypothetical protein